MFLEDNKEVVVQELLNGQEYIVNTVSYAGKHCVSDILKCTKIKVEGGGMQSSLEELIQFEGSVQKQLLDYSFNVVDALGIKYGPSHIELIMTKDGIRLIEIAARLQGAVNPEAMSMCIGTNHVDLTVTAYTDPRSFLSDKFTKYNLNKYLFRILMMVHNDGVLRDIPGLQKIKELKTFHDLDLHIKIGDRISKTVDYAACPGVIHLVHENYDLLKQEYAFIRNLEIKGLYDIV